MDFFFTQQSEDGHYKPSNEIIKSQIENTRLYDVYDVVSKLIEDMSKPKAMILISLLLFGDDYMYCDIIRYAKMMNLTKVLDKFTLLQDSAILTDFMDDMDAIPRQSSYKRFRAEADTDATVKIGQQHTEDTGMGDVIQTLTVADEQEAPVLDMTAQPDMTRMNEDNFDVSALANFLERPRIINTFTWTPAPDTGGQFVNSDGVVNFRPWQQYLTHVSVANKINNFRMFRSRGMRVSFRVNGSPFHYGRLYAGYCPGPNGPLPFSGQDNPSNSVLQADNLGSFSAASLPLKTHYTQWPGIFIDPTTNMSQHLDIPFMWPLNYCSMVSDVDTFNLGFIKIWQLTPLRHSNGATDPINVVVTAQILDPVLTMPTSVDAFVGEAYIAEAGEAGSGSKSSNPPKTRKAKKEATNSNDNAAKNGKKDEYGKGAVSAPATAVAKFAGTLEKVPVIGQYATATKIAATTIANIAAMFGFSKPTIVTDPGYSRLIGNGPMSCATGGDNSLKLTLDPKQEITVDPTVVGLQNIDEMALAHLFKRESLLLEMPWPITTTPNTNLAHIACGPWNKPVNIASGVEFNTALSWASQPFQYWRGSLKYRFQIVASQMHRGRLAIVFNPNIAATTTNTLPPQTVTHQYFMDLTECRDMTITVRYAHYTPWLLNQGAAFNFIASGSSTFNDSVQLAANGFLSCYVLNRLASPDNISGVTVNIFISAGDDFMVAGPGANIDFFTPYATSVSAPYDGPDPELLLPPIDEEVSETPVGEFIAESADYTSPSEAMPVSTISVVINGSEDNTPDVDDVSLVHFGEQIVSLRSLLKRYCYYYSTYPFTNSPTFLQRFTTIHGGTPQYRGVHGVNAAGNSALGNGPTGVNVCKTNFLTWYMPGYMAYRGGTRWKHTINSLAPLSPVNNYRVSRGILPLSNRYQRTVTGSALGTSAGASEAVVNAAYYSTDSVPESANSGIQLQYLNVGNTMEFEHPFYCPNRFVFHKFTAPTTITTDPNNAMNYQGVFFNRDYHRTDVFFVPATVNSPFSAVDIYVSAAEDFSLHYFIGAPVMGFQTL